MTKKGEQLKEVKGDTLLDKVVGAVKKIKSVFTGDETETGIFHDFIYFYITHIYDHVIGISSHSI